MRAVHDLVRERCSPLSGPFRYDHHQGCWVHHRDGRELLSRLQQELQQLLGTAPDLAERGV
jgi:frataxin-like iron-binding protein CyaY